MRPQELTAVRTIWVPGHTSLGDITLEDAYAGALAILQITVFLPAPPSVEGPEVLREERGLRVYNEPVKCSALTWSASSPSRSLGQSFTSQERVILIFQGLLHGQL